MPSAYVPDHRPETPALAPGRPGRRGHAKVVRIPARMSFTIIDVTQAAPDARYAQLIRQRHFVIFGVRGLWPDLLPVCRDGGKIGVRFMKNRLSGAAPAAARRIGAGESSGS